MTVDDLVMQFRSDADDAVLPYLWSSTEVMRWLNESQHEAALRSRLLLETTDPTITQIALQVGVLTYKLHSSVFELTNIRYKATGDNYSYPVHLVTRKELDRIAPWWRDENNNRPTKYVFQDENTLVLTQAPVVTGMLYIEAFRLPLIALDSSEKEPEINAAHHRHLVKWMLHRAFSKPDTETMDPQRADRSEKEFTRYFGLRPDAGLRRETQSNTSQHNQAW